MSSNQGLYRLIYHQTKVTRFTENLPLKTTITFFVLIFPHTSFSAFAQKSHFFTRQSNKTIRIPEKTLCAKISTHKLHYSSAGIQLSNDCCFPFPVMISMKVMSLFSPKIYPKRPINLQQLPDLSEKQQNLVWKTFNHCESFCFFNLQYQRQNK